MFLKEIKFKRLRKQDVSNSTNNGKMFKESSLIDLKLLSSWDTLKFESPDSMFI